MESRRPRGEGPAGWALALAASAALHGGLALLLFAPGGAEAPPARPPRLVPFLVEGVSAEPEPSGGGQAPRAGPGPGPAAARGSPARGAAPPPAAEPVGRPAAPPPPASTGAAEGAAGGPPGAEAAGGGPVEQAGPGGTASPGGAVTEYGGAAGAGLSPDDARLLAAVHARLRQAAVRCAPAAVRRFGARGEVLLDFCLGPAGGVERLLVQRSSGVDVLDEAATACVVPGAAPFPAEASGRCFTVPVQF